MLCSNAEHLLSLSNIQNNNQIRNSDDINNIKLEIYQRPITYCLRAPIIQFEAIITGNLMSFDCTLFKGESCVNVHTLLNQASFLSATNICFNVSSLEMRSLMTVFGTI